MLFVTRVVRLSTVVFGLCACTTSTESVEAPSFAVSTKAHIAPNAADELAETVASAPPNTEYVCCESGNALSGYWYAWQTTCATQQTILGDLPVQRSVDASLCLAEIVTCCKVNGENLWEHDAGYCKKRGGTPVDRTNCSPYEGSVCCALATGRVIYATYNQCAKANGSVVLKSAPNLDACRIEIASAP